MVAGVKVGKQGGGYDYKSNTRDPYNNETACILTMVMNTKSYVR
jgi:hypothetical protein